MEEVLFEYEGEVDVDGYAKEGGKKCVLELRGEIVEGEGPTQQIR